MKPIMNPPPVTTLGTENTRIMMPPAFVFPGFVCSSMAPTSTRTPNISPTAVRRCRSAISLAEDPGSVGIIQGTHVAAAPRSAELLNIKIPAISDNMKALVGFSLRLTNRHILLGFGVRYFGAVIPGTCFASSRVQLRILSQSRKS